MHNVAQLRRLRERFPAELVVIGVHSAKFTSEQTTMNIREAVRRYGIEHPVVNDADFQIWNAFNIHAWPTVVVIDPNGEIVGAQPGEIDAEEFLVVLERMSEDFEHEGRLDRKPLELAQVAPTPGQALLFPARVAVAPDERLFVADTGHHRVLELHLEPDGSEAEVQRVFGNGQAGFRDGPGGQALFEHPHGLAWLRETLYVADTGNHAVRAIDLASGEVRTVAGTGQKGGHSIEGGAPTEIALRSPWGLLALDEATQDGQPLLFIAMAGSHQVWVLLGEERLGVFAGNGREALIDGPLASASFNQPSDLALGMGHLLVADPEASAIRAISLGEDARVATLVGAGLFEFGDVDGAGQEVRLQHPAALAFKDGLIYLADTYNNKIKTLDPTSGQAETLIGSGQAGFTDGLFEQASLYEPEGLTVMDHLLFIADTNNHRIRVADLNWRTVSTLSLTGLEKLRIGGVSSGPAGRWLEPLKVAPGLVEITLGVQLPPGYHLNAELPSSLRTLDEEGEAIQPFDANGTVTLIRSTVDEAEPFDLSLDLTLYYCQDRDQGLCLIYDRQLILPLVVEAGAPSMVRVDVAVEG